MRASLLSVCASIAVAGLAASAAARPEASRPARIQESAPPTTALQHALETTTAGAPDPDRARGTLLMRMSAWPTCYRDDLTPEEWEAVFQATGLLPPGDGGGGVQVRFYTELDAWVGEALTHASGRAQRANLTYSFPGDGTTWGLSASGFPTGPNVLNATLMNVFGDLDLGREHIRQSLAAWRTLAGLGYVEVADSNVPMDQLTSRQPDRGDIRIGALALGTPSGVLAYNAYPIGSGVGAMSGGDMCLNSSYFLPAYMANPGSTYRYLRNTVAHEHGHGIGLRHAVPCDLTKLMEPQVGGLMNGLQLDDIRGGQRNYGDRLSGNSSSAAPTQLGDLTTPVVRSVLLTDLSTNGVSGFNASSEDWFTFTLSSPQAVVITATPEGETYTTAPQTSGCTGSPNTTINAAEAGDLLLSLRRPANTVLFQVFSAPPGSPETINAGTLAAGTYFVQVRDIGPNPTANQRVQMYSLRIQVGAGLAPPLAIAGINKRTEAGADCWLFGHVNSRAIEPGATLTSDAYAWDLDADGVFESAGSPISTQYVSNGTHQAALRVTDSNGLTATDAINVVVWGATTTVTGVSPPGAAPGTTIPVTITGTNFKGVTSSSQVSVSGSGVTVVGTPVVNHRGTQIAGLSFTVAAGAALGARNVSIINSDGQGSAGTGAGVFTVGSPSGACCHGGNCTVVTQAACAGSGGAWQGAATACGPAANPTTCCRANFDGVGGVAVPDIFAFLAAWFAGQPSANFDGVGGVTVQDIFAFLAAWFAGCSSP